MAMKLHKNMRLWLILWMALAGAAAAQAQTPKLDVRISGVQGELLDNVRAFLGIVALERRAEVPLTRKLNPFAGKPDAAAALTDDQVRRAHRQAPGEIRQALAPYGYYAPDIDDELRRTEEGWRASYRIDPGPATKLEKVDIEVRGAGSTQAAVEKVLAGVKIASGQRLNHAAYETVKQNLYEAAYGNGYLDAHYTRSEIRVEPKQRRASITLHLDTGPRYYFGPIEIRQDILRPSFAQRFVDVEPGEVFDSQRLLDLQLVLNDSDYFNRVEIQTDKAAASDQRVPVTVITEPRKSQSYTAGAGFGTDTGPRLRLGAQLRRINRRGHQLRADLLVSAVKRSLSAQYLIPFKNVARDRYALSATALQEELGDADTDQFTIGVSRNDGWHGFRRRLYLDFHRENFDFSGPSQRSDLLFPGLTLTRKKADDELFTRRGYSISADLHGGAEALLSDTSFGRASIDGRAVYPWSERGRLLLHGQLGAVWTDDFDVLPPSQRFFTGGDRSVRGYDYQAIGPRDAQGDTIGGEYLLAGGVEVDYLLFGDYGAALFFDAGDAFSDSADIQKSAGVGLRWRSPVGMVRLDFAHPFDDPDDDFRFHLSIGPDL